MKYLMTMFAVVLMAVSISIPQMVVAEGTPSNSSVDLPAELVEAGQAETFAELKAAVADLQQADPNIMHDSHIRTKVIADVTAFTAEQAEARRQLWRKLKAEGNLTQSAKDRLLKQAVEDVTLVVRAQELIE